MNRFLFKKNFNRFTILLVLLGIISIGYSLISTPLNIEGVSSIKKMTWDVHFENIVIERGEELLEEAINIDDNTKINFKVDLKKYNDGLVFKVNVVNRGTISAMIGNINKTLLTDDQKKYLIYEVTYADANSTPIKKNDKLNVGEIIPIRVTIKYKDGEISNIPYSLNSFSLSYSIDYVQADNIAKDIRFVPNLNLSVNDKTITANVDNSFTINLIDSYEYYFSSNSSCPTSGYKKSNVYTASSFGTYYVCLKVNYSDGETAFLTKGVEVFLGETASEKIIKKANPVNVVNYTDVSVDKQKEAFAFNPPKTVQIPHPTIEYRYIGKDPNNYIKFNNEVWRIIGVFNDKLKIMRKESIGSYSWNNELSGGGTSNDWSDSKIKEVLNSGPYWNKTSGICPSNTSDGTVQCDFSSTGLTPSAKNQIVEMIYYLGLLSDYNLPPPKTGKSFGTGEEIYKQERSINTFAGSFDYDGIATEGGVRSVNWRGKVGLISASDYAYTFSKGINDSCFINMWSCNNSNSWLTGDKATISSYSNSSSWNINIIYNKMLRSDPVGALKNIFPVVYLKKNIMLQGTGTSADPYIII